MDALGFSTVNLKDATKKLSDLPNNLPTLNFISSKKVILKACGVISRNRGKDMCKIEHTF